MLDLGMMAVLLLGLDRLERGISQHGVAAPEGEQLDLALPALRVASATLTDDLGRRPAAHQRTHEPSGTTMWPAGIRGQGRLNALSRVRLEEGSGHRRR
jgi:hypothetical protein